MQGIGMFLVACVLLVIAQLVPGIIDQKITAPSEPEGIYGWGLTMGGGSQIGQVAPLSLDYEQEDFDTIALGLNFAIGLKSDGTMWSRGNNGNARTAQGTSSSLSYTHIWTQVDTDTDWAWISAGQSYGAAIKTNGTLWIWGSNQNGKTGQGTTAGTLVSPTQVGVDTDWERVDCGVNTTMTIKGGQLYAFGSNLNYLTGLNTNIGNELTPVVVNTDTDWNECYISAGWGGAIKAGGEIWTWGPNQGGRTGQGTTLGNTQIPTQVGSDTDWDKIRAANSHGGALKTNGTLWTWGANTLGQTAQGTISGNTLIPTQVGSDTDWEGIAMYSPTSTLNMENFTFAIKAGSLYAAGSNNYGQLGLPLSTTNVDVFTEVVPSATNFTKVVGAPYGGYAVRKNP